MLISLTIVVFSILPLSSCRSIEIRLPDENLPEETSEETFLRSDSDKDNQLSFDEFLRTELVYVAMKQDEFRMYDTNNDGMVSRAEYEKVQNRQQQQKTELRAQYFAQLFEEFDKDFNMKLDENEIRNILANRFLLKPREKFSQIFKTFDKNGDGALDIAEYIGFDEKVSFDDMDPIAEVTNVPAITLKREKLPMAKKSKKLLL